MNSRNHPQNKREFVLLVILLGSIIATGPLAIDMYLPSFLAIAQSLIVAEERVQISITAYPKSTSAFHIESQAKTRRSQFRKVLGDVISAPILQH